MLYARRIITLSLLIIAISTFTPLIAQIEINEDEIPMEAGTVKSFYVSTDTAGIEVEIGAAGGNRQWDFTGYILGEMENDTLIDPEEAPDEEDYPNANRVLRTMDGIFSLNGNEVYQYEAVTDSGWFLYGSINVEEGGGGFDLSIPFDFNDNPQLIAPIPIEFGEEWEIGFNYVYGLEANPDWGEEFALLDSVYIVLEIGGFSNSDAWGTALYTGGEVDVIRQHIWIGGDITIIGVTEIFGRRVEIEIPLGLEFPATHVYRWYAPDIGIVASITSLPMEEEEEFNLAGKVRVLSLPPEISVHDSTLDFGVLDLGNGAIAEITISNAGEGVGIISEIEIDDDLFYEIELLTDLPVFIETDEEQTLRFLWVPEEDRNLEDRVVKLMHNDPALKNPFEVNLRGSTPNDIEQQELSPVSISVIEAYPNPFNSSVVIRYSVPVSDQVQLKIYNINGTMVAELIEDYRTTGVYNTVWTPEDIPNGVYITSLHVGSRTLTQKLLYVK